ncbi:MAG: hypothetical protein EXS28_06380 [Pedosphaera sp.]|nr:hypothetical protein [Pedosphaera sp.]
MSVTVKICGITCVEDAMAAADADANAIGLMFFEKSPRYVALDIAAAINRAPTSRTRRSTRKSRR